MGLFDEAKRSDITRLACTGKCTWPGERAAEETMPGTLRPVPVTVGMRVGVRVLPTPTGAAVGLRVGVEPPCAVVVATSVHTRWPVSLFTAYMRPSYEPTKTKVVPTQGQALISGGSAVGRRGTAGGRNSHTTARKGVRR